MCAEEIGCWGKERTVNVSIRRTILRVKRVLIFFVVFFIRIVVALLSFIPVWHVIDLTICLPKA